MSSGNPTGPRGRLHRSGRYLPLVKPQTIAPPVEDEFDEDDAYAEVSIERGPIVEMEDPRAPAAADPDEGEDDEDADTPPR